jgi:hypothetical protein
VARYFLQFRPSRRDIFSIVLCFSIVGLWLLALPPKSFCVLGFCLCVFQLWDFWVCSRSPIISSNPCSCGCICKHFLVFTNLGLFLKVALLRPLAFPAPCRKIPSFGFRVFCVFEFPARLRPIPFPKYPVTCRCCLFRRSRKCLGNLFFNLLCVF